MLLTRKRERGADRGERWSDARQPLGFSQGSPLPIVFFRGTASLSSLSSELSDARLRQLYRRPRERFAADNRNRLQTFRVAPAAISTLSPHPPLPPAISSFLRALFHRRQQTIQAPDVDRVATTTKSFVGKAIVPAWRSGHRAFLVSAVARRPLYDRRTSTTTTTTTTKTTTAAVAFFVEDVILWEFVFLPGPRSLYGVLSFLVFPPLFATSCSAHHLAMHANARA